MRVELLKPKHINKKIGSRRWPIAFASYRCFICSARQLGMKQTRAKSYNIPPIFAPLLIIHPFIQARRRRGELSGKQLLPLTLI